MRDIDLRDINWKRLASRRALFLFGIAVLLVAGGLLGWRWYQKASSPGLVRWKLNRYLKKESGAGSFAVTFPFPSKEEMAAAPEAPAEEKGSRTGRDFEALRDEYVALKTAALRQERLAARQGRNETNAPSELAAKEQGMAAIVDDLWEFQRRWMAQLSSTEGVSEALASAQAKLVRDAEQQLAGAGSYEAMYRAIGQELFVSGRLLESKNPAHRRMAVEIAFAAARHALDHAMNGYVAARICEGYILPNADLAKDTNPRSRFREDRFLADAADLFRRNNEHQNVARVYERYLATGPDVARADWARSQIATAYEDAGRPREAIAVIRQIQNTNAYSRFIRRIARLEQEAAAEN